MEHIIYGCQTLAAESALTDKLSSFPIPPGYLCKYYDIKVDAQYWYEHNLDRVMENDKVIVLLESQIIITDIHTPCNKTRYSNQGKGYK